MSFTNSNNIQEKVILGGVPGYTITRFLHALDARVAPVPPHESGSVATLVPLITLVFIAYLVIGIAMPVLPLDGHQGLGVSTFNVGVVPAASSLVRS